VIERLQARIAELESEVGHLRAASQSNREK
jgi:hypothetical protein